MYTRYNLTIIINTCNNNLTCTPCKSFIYLHLYILHLYICTCGVLLYTNSSTFLHTCTPAAAANFFWCSFCSRYIQTRGIGAPNDTPSQQREYPTTFWTIWTRIQRLFRDFVTKMKMLC